jgi:hypothetical protein
LYVVHTKFEKKNIGKVLCQPYFILFYKSWAVKAPAEISKVSIPENVLCEAGMRIYTDGSKKEEEDGYAVVWRSKR